MNDIVIHNIIKLNDGIRIHWTSNSLGFGMLDIGVREDGSIWFDTEHLGKEFLKAILNKMVDDAEIAD